MILKLRGFMKRKEEKKDAVMQYDMYSHCASYISNNAGVCRRTHHVYASNALPRTPYQETHTIGIWRYTFSLSPPRSSRFNSLNASSFGISRTNAQPAALTSTMTCLEGLCSASRHIHISTESFRGYDVFAYHQEK